jgi:putative transposase
MNRGARREPTFTDPDHCTLFLEHLGYVARRFELEVHAYVLMPNHFHLLVRSVRGNLSRCMQQLLGRYTQALNLKHGWDGPVFRGRFKNQVVSESEHLQIVVPYIHLNPVRAGLVPAPHMALWSSFPHYLKPEGEPEWLTTDLVLSIFEGVDNLAAETVSLQRGELAWPTDFDLGRGIFTKWSPEIPRTKRQKEQWVQEQVEYVEDVVRQVCDLSWTEVCKSKRGRHGNPARRFAIWLFLTQTDLSHQQIADGVSATVQQVTVQIHRLRNSPLETPLSTWIQAADIWLKNSPEEGNAEGKANT